MDCNCNDSGSRCDASSGRRANTCQHNNSSSRQRMMGNYHNNRYSSNMNRMDRDRQDQTARNSSGICSRCGRSMDNCQCRRERDGRSGSRPRSMSSGDYNQKERGCISNVMRATESMPVGMTYTPYQEFDSLYEWDTALCQGTLFADLDKPFLVTDCAQGGIRR